LFIAAIALTAFVGLSASRHGGDVRTTPTVDTVRLPNLADPAVRQRFVDSFDSGYFTAPR
jgi:hypothetical protein